jgi:hypothetical protein
MVSPAHEYSIRPAEVTAHSEDIIVFRIRLCIKNNGGQPSPATSIILS